MHTPTCPDVPTSLETIIAPSNAKMQTLGGAPGAATVTGHQCTKLRCLVVAHVGATPIWISLVFGTNPAATERVHIAVRPGTTRVLLSKDVTDVLVPAVAIALWNEDLPTMMEDR